MAEHARKVRLSDALDLAPAPDSPEMFDADGPVSAPAIGGLLVGSAHDPAEADADRMAGAAIRRLASRGGPLNSSGPVQDHAESGACGHPPDGHDATPDGTPLRRSLATTGPLSAGSIPGRTIGADGGALDGATTDRLQRTVGGGQGLTGTLRRDMETAFDRPLSHVRLHTGPDGAQMSHQMGAAAFTSGSDVFFGQGQFSPDTAEGQHTLAHEIAHTLQPDQQVRRKLAGTAKALKSQGGGKSSSVGRKAVAKVGVFGVETKNWDQIVSGVRAYEKLEAAATGLPDGKLARAKAKMLAQINVVLAAIDDWEAANPNQGVANAAATTDTRDKAERRQVIAMLRPRLGNERTLLRSADDQAWASSPVLNESTAVAWRGKAAGAVNQVQEGVWQTGTSRFQGYFKAETGYNTAYQAQEADVGIPKVDPNLGARTVAMYRLDQLFGAQVTARAEFVVRTITTPQGSTSVLGTALATATGKPATEFDVAHNADAGGFQGDPGSEVLDLTNPTLQRSLNKLQLFDVICGQLDRHMGNYTIDTDGNGDVRGVTGIDLDMAFGADMHDVDEYEDYEAGHAKAVTKAQVEQRPVPRKGPRPTTVAATNYKGLPEYVDEDFGNTILAMDPRTVHDALYGLLSDAEITATLARLAKVQDFVRTAIQDNRTRRDWGAGTAVSAARVSEGETRVSGSIQAKPTYHADIESLAADRLRKRYKNEVTSVVGGAGFVHQFLAPLLRYYDPVDMTELLTIFRESLTAKIEAIAMTMARKDYVATTTALSGRARTEVIEGFLSSIFTANNCEELGDAFRKGKLNKMRVSMVTFIEAASDPAALARLVAAAAP